MKRSILLVVGVLLVCSTAMPAAGQDEGTPALRLKALKAERLAAHPQAAVAAVAAKTVVVDCAKHGSISDALAKNTGPLVIELRGVCKENVRIERNDVTLRGVDPASDGIQGVTADPQPNAALEFYYANRISLENISVSDSPGMGVGAWFSILTMLNCRVERNGSNGIHISASSGLTGTELVVSNNTGTGINSQRGGFVTCLGCKLENNMSWAATSGLGGFITLWNPVLSYAGISADGAGSYVDVDCVSVVTNYPCAINGEGRAATATNGAVANLLGVGSFVGRVMATEGGTVGVYGGQQTVPLPNVYPNVVLNFGRLETGVAEDGGPTTTLGRTILGTFAHAVLQNATVLSSTLTCNSGADAWSDTSYSAAQVIGCTNVPTSP